MLVAALVAGWQAGGQISSNRRDQPSREVMDNQLVFACLSVGLDSPRSPPDVSPNQGGILQASCPSSPNKAGGYIA